MTHDDLFFNRGKMAKSVSLLTVRSRVNPCTSTFTLYSAIKYESSEYFNTRPSNAVKNKKITLLTQSCLSNVLLHIWFGKAKTIFYKMPTPPPSVRRYLSLAESRRETDCLLLLETSVAVQTN